MEDKKKTYVKPEVTVVEVKMEPIMAGSGYPTNGDRWNYPFN